MFNLKLKSFKKAVSNKKFQKISRKSLVKILLFLIVAGLIFIKKDLFIVARVNNSFISRINFINEMEKQSGSQILDNMITQKLVLQEAQNKTILVDDSQVNKEAESIENRLKEQNIVLDEALKIQGQTRKDFNKNIKIGLIIERLLADKIKVSDEEVEKYFTENKSFFEPDTKFEDVKSEIIDTLRQQKLSTEYQNFTQELRSKAKINIFTNF